MLCSTGFGLPVTNKWDNKCQDVCNWNGQGNDFKWQLDIEQNIVSCKI